MLTVMTDDKRRFTMPKTCPPRSALTIQEVDENTWLVKRAMPETKLIMVMIPHIEKLPDDPEWEALEHRMAQHCSKNLAPFEE